MGFVLPVWIIRASYLRKNTGALHFGFDLGFRIWGLGFSWFRHDSFIFGVAQAFAGVLAPLGAGEVQARVLRLLPALGAGPVEVVLPELQLRPAVRARGAEDVAGLPTVLRLAWAFHFHASEYTLRSGVCQHQHWNF